MTDQMIVDVSHAAYMVQNAGHSASMAIVSAANQHARPSAVFKPSIYPDGTMWCALLGENLMEGVAGFGDTPEAAAIAFDKNWMTGKTPAAIAKAEGETP